MANINHEEKNLLSEYVAFYHSWYLSAQQLTKEQRADFYDSIFNFAFYGEEPGENSDPIILFSFEIIRNLLDKALIRRESNKANGRKGGIAKAEAQRIRKSIQDKNKENDFLANSSNCQNIGNIENDIESEIDNEIEKDTEKEKDIETYIEKNKESNSDGDKENDSISDLQDKVNFLFNLLTETKVDYEQFVKIKKYNTSLLFNLIHTSLNHFSVKQIENAFVCYRKEYINQDEEMDLCSFLMNEDLINKYSSVLTYKKDRISWSF